MACKPSSDRILFFTAGLLTIFGLVMVYSASSVVSTSQYGTSSYIFLKQLLHAGAGFALLIIMMNVDFHVWQKPKVIGTLLVGCVILLAFVLTQGPVNGANRWIRYGPISFQPSEIAKLVVLMFVAAYLYKHESEINQPVRRLLPLAAVVLLIVGLIVKEPDLGQALCICMITGIALCIAGLAWYYTAGAVLLAVPAAFYFCVVREPYRWERIQAFLNRSQDPLNSGWQVNQSLIAVGSGGPWGLGLGASRQKLFFLPEASSDFIFAVIGEELGVIATCLVTLAFLVFFYRGIRITLRSPDRFGFYLGLSITLMVAVQAFINISMVLAMMPAKGIALPFISQGGSSLLLNLTATGVLLNLSSHNMPEAAE